MPSQGSVFYSGGEVMFLRQQCLYFIRLKDFKTFGAEQISFDNGLVFKDSGIYTGF